MTFCYETLIDSGESDFIFYGNFLNPSSNDVLLVKNNKLVLYSLNRNGYSSPRSESQCSNSTRVSNDDTTDELDNEETLEHVCEFDLNGYILSARKLDRLMYFPNLVPSKFDANFMGGKSNGSSNLDTSNNNNTERKNQFLDGLAILLEDYNLLVCHFNVFKLEFELVLSLYMNDNFEVSATNNVDRNTSSASATTSSNKAKNASANNLLVYDGDSWEIFNKFNNCKTYFKNYLVVFVYNQKLLYVLNLQSFYNYFVPEVDVVNATTGSSNAASPNTSSASTTTSSNKVKTKKGKSSDLNTSNVDSKENNAGVKTPKDDVSVLDDGASLGGKRKFTEDKRNQKDKVILKNYMKLDIHERFNLFNNNSIKTVALIDNYYTPILGVLISNYLENINLTPINNASSSSTTTSSNTLSHSLTSNTTNDTDPNSINSGTTNLNDYNMFVIMNVEMLTLNLNIVNRIDNLPSNTINIYGYHYNNFIGFIGYTNDSLYWFKVFYSPYSNKSYNYSYSSSDSTTTSSNTNKDVTMSPQSKRRKLQLQQQQFLEQQNKGIKEENNNFSSNSNFNQVANKNQELQQENNKMYFQLVNVYSLFTLNTGSASATTSSNKAKNASVNYINNMNLNLELNDYNLHILKDNSLLLLPNKMNSSNNIFIGDMVYSNSNIDNILFRKVAAEKKNNYKIYGNCYSVCEKDGKLFVLNSSSNNLIQLFYLSTQQLLQEKEENNNSSSNNNFNQVANNNQELQQESLLALENNKLTINELNVEINFLYNNAAMCNGSTRVSNDDTTDELDNEEAVKNVRSIKSLGFLKSLNNYTYNPFMLVDNIFESESAASDSSSVTTGSKTSSTSSSRNLGNKISQLKNTSLSCVLGIRNDNDVVKLYNGYTAHLQLLLESDESLETNDQKNKNNKLKINNSNILYNSSINLKLEGNNFYYNFEVSATNNVDRNTSATSINSTSNTTGTLNSNESVLLHIKLKNNSLEKVKFYNEFTHNNKQYVTYLTLNNDFYLYDLDSGKFVFRLWDLLGLKKKLNLDTNLVDVVNTGTNTSASPNTSSTSTTTSSNKDLKEEVVLCYLTSLNNKVFLVLLVTGYQLRVYKLVELNHFLSNYNTSSTSTTTSSNTFDSNNYFKLVKHNCLVPFPSVLLQHNDSTYKLDVNTSNTSSNNNKDRLVVLPYLKVKDRSLLKFTDGEECVELTGDGENTISASTAASSNTTSNSRNEYNTVLNKYVKRFGDFYRNVNNLVYLLKLVDNKLLLYKVNFLLPYNELSGNNDDGNECCDYYYYYSYYLDRDNLYVSNECKNALYVYKLNNYEYYYSNFVTTSVSGTSEFKLKVTHQRSVAVVNNTSSTSTTSFAGTSNNGLCKLSWNDTVNYLNNSYLYNVYTYFNVLNNVNFLTVSSNYYLYNSSTDSVSVYSKDDVSVVDDGASLGGKRKFTEDKRNQKDEKLVLGKLVALGVSVKENMLEKLYNMLNVRNRLQLIHINTEATKLDKLTLNKQLSHYVHYYQFLSTMVNNNTSSASTATSSNNGGDKDNNKNDLQQEDETNYVVVCHSSNMRNLLYHYKLNAFNNLLSLKFTVINNKEYLVLGTCSNLGEFVECKGDVIVLDFLSNAPNTSSASTTSFAGTSNKANNYLTVDSESLESNKKLLLDMLKSKPEMTMYYKKSFLFPITHVSSLHTEFAVDQYLHSSSSKAKNTSTTSSSNLGSDSKENKNNKETEENEEEREWLMNQLYGNAKDNDSSLNNNSGSGAYNPGQGYSANHIVHSVGSDIYIHEFKSTYSPESVVKNRYENKNRDELQMYMETDHNNINIIRGAFSNLYACVSSLCMFNNYILVGDLLKGLSFFIYVYDNTNDSKNIIRIASTNPKTNMSVLSCCPLISEDTLTLLASDDNNNLLQFIPSNYVNNDKDKLIVIGGTKFSNNVVQLMKYNSPNQGTLNPYSILAVESSGSVHKVFMLNNNVFNLLKKLELVYDNSKQSNFNIKQETFTSVINDNDLVNLQSFIPGNSTICLHTLRNLYFENNEFYKLFLNQLNLSQHSLYDLFNFMYQQLYSF